MTPLLMPTLSHEEKSWILARRYTRITDGQEALLTPMGAERYLATQLFEPTPYQAPLKRAIEGKRVLVVPGYATHGFLFSQAGAHAVTVYDKDPLTVTWLKAFKHYYHYQEKSTYPSIGTLLNALTEWYPPLLPLPNGRFHNLLRFALCPQALRRVYFEYLLTLTGQAIQTNQQGTSLPQNIVFHTGDLSVLMQHKIRFDVAFVPYLLGVQHGVQHEKEIVHFIEQLLTVATQVWVTPTQAHKKLGIIGKRYFNTTPYATLSAIPALHRLMTQDMPGWYAGQGISVYTRSQTASISALNPAEASLLASAQ